MLIIPAIDLKDGRCVRLQQGRMDSATVFSEDPVAMARHWAAQGAKRLHIVDLNGAIAGRPKNEKVIREMIKAVGDRAVQVDDMQALRALRGPVAGHRDRILREYRRAAHVALLQAHAAAVLQVNCRNDEHLVLDGNQGRQRTKLERSCRPADWLFSGWNCTAKMLSRATAQVKGAPYTHVAAVSAALAGAG